MKWNEKITSYFKRASGRSDRQSVAKIINMLGAGYSPYAIMGNDIYNVPEIRTTINFVAEKVALVPFSHVKIDADGNSKVVNDAVNYVLNVRANPYQSPTKFKESIIKRLFLANNVYILPEWTNSGELAALWPLPFSRGEYKTINGVYYIIFNGSDGPYKFPYEDIIHITRFSDLKDGAKNDAPREYIEVSKSLQKQAVTNAKNSGKINAVMYSDVPLKEELQKQKLEKFKDLFLTSENTTGIGMIDQTYRLEPLNLQTNNLNVNVMKEINNYLYNYFGTSTELISNNATELQMEQFIDGTVKPVVQQMQEELRFKIFSRTELLQGNDIAGDTLILEISTLTAKTSFIDRTMYHGVLNANEARKYIGIPRGPKELDEYRPNLNGVNAKLIDQYQGGGEKNGNEE